LINGIESIVYVTADIEQANTFFTDCGLVKHDRKWMTQRGSSLQVKPDGPIEIVFGVDEESEEQDLVDPNGFKISLRKTQKTSVSVGSLTNNYVYKMRVNQPAPIYDKPNPVDIAHIVLYTNKLKETEQFYLNLGFIVSDRFIDTGVFMRSSVNGAHHTIFIQHKKGFEPGINHVALSARDIYDVFASGMYVKEKGWKTKMGPGRHIISSACFWYFENPIGGALEFVADEDFLTEEWQPREFEYTPQIGYEWKIW
jgi:catechol 2,3-dioxygenase-like lactoylglutathione lyase family enzyme